MKKILFLGALALTVAFTACTNKQAKADATATDSLAVAETVTTPAYVGEYEGTLPCASCPGIKTYLKLNDDTTYDYKQEYLEQKDGNFEQSGVYTVENDLITLITPSTNEKIYYKIKDGAVMFTDSLGTVPADAKFAELNTLKKK